MVAYALPTQLVKRDDPLGAPSDVAGINGQSATVVDTSAAATQTQLAVNKSATGSNVGSAPPLNIVDSTSQIVLTTSASVLPTPTSTPSTEATAVSAAASAKPISMSTVIGSCVGAFIGASALIVLGIWFYRRYSRSLKSRGRTRGPLIHARNLQGDEHRRQSRLEPWNKLEDGDDKWEDMYQTKETKEIDQVAPMEKLTMFKKTPSVRTAYTHKSTNIAAFDFPQSYSQLGSVPSLTSSIPPQPQPFLDHVEVPSMTSNWDTDTVGNASYLTARSNADGGAMSPTLHIAIPTPHPVVSQAHKWESAEVVQYSDAPQADVDNNQDSEGYNRRSAHNPFFNAQDTPPRSRSNSVAKSPKAKGKERMRYSEVDSEVDPFQDSNEQMEMPRPAFVQHAPTASSSSTESKERALQSLIAALDISEDEVRDRLRIASMQPSVISQISSAGGYDDDRDVTKDFPLPPPRSGGNGSHLP